MDSSEYQTLLIDWRVQPSPGLGVLLRHLAAAHDLKMGGIPGHTRAERKDAWQRINRLGDNRDTQRLVMALVSFDRRTAEQLLGSLLPSRIPDPAAGLALATLLKTPPGGFEGWNARIFWLAVLRLAVHCADAAVEQALCELAALLDTSADFRTSVGPAIKGALDLTAVAEVTARHGDDPPEVQARVRQLEAGSRESAPLYDAVYAALPDDGTRAVLADVLQLAGDPRGTFLQLQLLPKRSREQNRLVKQLLEAHGKTWLGPIAPVFLKTGLKFARGFPVAGKLSHGRDAEAFRGHREWRTLESLDLHSWNLGEGLFQDAVFDSLHTLTGVSTAVLAYPSLAGLKTLAASTMFTRGADALTSATPTALENLSLELWDGDAQFESMDWSAPLFGSLKRLTLHRCRRSLLATRHELPGDFLWVIPSDGNHPWEYSIRGKQVEVRYGWRTEDYGWKRDLTRITAELGRRFERVTLILRNKTLRSEADLEFARGQLAGMGATELALPSANA